MKQIIKSMGMAVAIAFCSVNASAQFFGGEGGPFGGEGGPQRMSVEEMAKTQGTTIAKGLKLKKAVTKKFVATYTEYQKELQLLRRSMEPQDRKERRDRRRSNRRGNDGQQRPPRPMGTPTDSVPAPPDTIAPGAPAAPDSVNARRMNTRQRMVRHGEPSADMKQKMAVMQEKTKALREKYAAIYAEYLSPEQIAKIYELEKKAEEQRRQEMRLRFEQMRQMNGPMGGGNRGGGWGGGDF